MHQTKAHRRHEIYNTTTQKRKHLEGSNFSDFPARRDVDPLSIRVELSDIKNLTSTNPEVPWRADLAPMTRRVQMRLNPDPKTATLANPEHLQTRVFEMICDKRLVMHRWKKKVPVDESHVRQ